jgi:hypothetical protein
MKVRVQIVIETEGSQTITEVTCLERTALLPETLGLTLEEAKSVVASIQEVVVSQQVETYLTEQRHCPYCGTSRSSKGQHSLTLRTLFGKLKLSSPRLYTCACEARQYQSFSPLAELLPERSTPELIYLQTQYATLMSYGLTTDLLGDLLPLHVSLTSLKRQVGEMALRCEQELGDEQVSFIEGCPREWNDLPIPDAPLTVGLDGGYVQARQGKNRKAGSFEVIVGKSMTAEKGAKCFGFVNTYDTKPRRRVFETLKAQGLQMNQSITFLSDGGDTVRDLQFYLSPNSEHLLDWFHVTMRLTVMGQIIKGLPDQLSLGKYPLDLAHQLERVKWFLWHGNVFQALQSIEDIDMDLEAVIEEHALPEAGKLLKYLREFQGYIKTNRAFIPNYGNATVTVKSSRLRLSSPPSIMSSANAFVRNSTCVGLNRVSICYSKSGSKSLTAIGIRLLHAGIPLCLLTSWIYL